MDKQINLTIEDRYRIVTYAHQIPSSVGVYFNFPAFVDKISLTDEEQAQYEVSVDENGKVVSNDPEKLFSYNTTDFPEVIINAIKSYVEYLNVTMADLREANKENPDYTDSPLYTDIVKYLSKLI